MNRTILISGAATGIGAAICHRLANEGDELILLGRNRQRLEGLAKELPNFSRHKILAADVRDAAAIRAGLRSFGLASGIGAVIANAGIGGSNQYGEGDRWDEVIATNVTGVYNLVNEALPYLQESPEKFRHVLVTSSILARLGVPGYSAYCASKAALLGLVRSWATEWASKNILVNAICPGWVDTDMARQGIEGIARATGKSYEEARKRELSLVPLNKMSEPQEIAAFVRFLVSKEQSSLTGQSLHVNNGALML